MGVELTKTIAHANQRKAKPREKRVKPISAARTPIVEPTPETMRHGEYEKQFIHHDETGTKIETRKNRRSHVIDKWIEEGGLGFEGGAVTAIRACEFLWERMKSEKLTASYGERIHGGLEGMDRHEAISKMAGMKKNIPKDYWSIFENLVRNRQPAGVAGSDLAKNSAQSIASARTVVGFVACKIAEENGY